MHDSFRETPVQVCTKALFPKTHTLPLKLKEASIMLVGHNFCMNLQYFTTKYNYTFARALTHTQATMQICKTGTGKTW